MTLLEVLQALVDGEKITRGGPVPFHLSMEAPAYDEFKKIMYYSTLSGKYRPYVFDMRDFGYEDWRVIE